MKLPFEFDLERPIFEIENKDQHIKIYLNGKVEGLEGSNFIINRFSGLITRLIVHFEDQLLSKDQVESSP